MKLFTDHPRSVGESYTQHLRTALGFGARMVGAGVACMLHALLPFLFKNTAKRAISDLHGRLVINRRRPAVGDQGTVLETND